MMKDDDFKLLRGFDYGRTDRRTDICDCRVAFATENVMNLDDLPDPLQVYCQCCRCGESRI